MTITHEKLKERYHYSRMAGVFEKRVGSKRKGYKWVWSAISLTIRATRWLASVVRDISLTGLHGFMSTANGLMG